MLDDRATINYILLGFYKRLGIIPLKLERAWRVSLANDTLDYVTYYIIIDIIVKDILYIIITFVYGADNAFDILLL